MCLLFSIDHPDLKMASQTKTSRRKNKVVVIQQLVCTLFFLGIYKVDALLPLLVNFALECAIRKVPVNQGLKMEWDTSASVYNVMLIGWKYKCYGEKPISLIH